MSFVYAEKSQTKFENDMYNCTKIYSDTKTTLTGAYLSNWSDKTRMAIEKYGFIKSAIINPKFSVSFAGNNTLYAHKLLEWISSKPKFTDEDVINKAFELHMSTDKDDIEFILCYVDNDETHITCIKERNIDIDCSSAWIGSYKAFCKMQELRTSSNTSLDLFKKAVEECEDDSVGGFIICTSYFENEQKFLFPERTELYKERQQIVQPDGEIIFSGSAATGDCTIRFHESENDVIIDFDQNNTSIIYTNKFRYSQIDIDNPNIKFFLLPIIFETDTHKIL
ncbi:MAG: hypothetical protein J1F11_01430 [Oscillospiraceae bacterium]|nr:hypothetical protein [Oscillospiraceae bacterium]